MGNFGINRWWEPALKRFGNDKAAPANPGRPMVDISRSINQRFFPSTSGANKSGTGKPKVHQISQETINRGLKEYGKIKPTPIPNTTRNKGPVVAAKTSAKPKATPNTMRGNNRNHVSSNLKSFGNPPVKRPKTQPKPKLRVTPNRVSMRNVSLPNKTVEALKNYPQQEPTKTVTKPLPGRSRVEVSPDKAGPQYLSDGVTALTGGTMRTAGQGVNRSNPDARSFAGQRTPEDMQEFFQQHGWRDAGGRMNYGIQEIRDTNRTYTDPVTMKTYGTDIEALRGESEGVTIARDLKAGEYQHEMDKQSLVNQGNLERQGLVNRGGLEQQKVANQGTAAAAKIRAQGDIDQQKEANKRPMASSQKQSSVKPTKLTDAFGESVDGVFDPATQKYSVNGIDFGKYKTMQQYTGGENWNGVAQMLATATSEGEFETLLRMIPPNQQTSVRDKYAKLIRDYQ